MTTRDPRKHGLMSATDHLVTFDVKGLGSVGLQLTGTWAGTVSFEVTIDGVTWVALNMTPSNSGTAASSATANGAWRSAIGGFGAVRARFSSYTSGTAEGHFQGAQG